MRAYRTRVASVAAAALVWTEMGSAQDCAVGGSIPCVVRWYQLSPIISRAQSGGYATTFLSAGEVLTAGTSLNSIYTDRFILKFQADGTPVYGLGIEGLPWFLGANSADDMADFPWHKIVLDESRGRLYVLFASQPSPITGLYGYHLAAHALATGERIPAWNSGYTQYVGPSAELAAGLDIDGNGDIWTVLQYSGVPGSMQLKKWSGANGANITPSATPGEHLSVLPTTPGVHKQFQAFGVRKTDNKIFLAYHESPQDATITLWSPTFTLLSRLNYSRELAPPAVLPPLHGCCGENMTDHPHFSDGFVDEQGRFVLAGTYRFRRVESEFFEYFTFPAVLRFALDGAGTGIQLSFEHYDDLHPARLYPDAITAAPAPVRAVGDATGRTFLSYVHQGRTVHLVSDAGSYVEHTHLPVPFSGNQGEPGCRYYATAEVRGLSYRADRLVLAGLTRRLLYPCGNEDSTAFTITYGRDFAARCCILRPMPWDYEKYSWFFRDWTEPWNPPRLPPDPDPCPMCRPDALISPRLLRAVELLTSKRAPAEMPSVAARGLVEALAQLPAGPFFTESMRKTLSERLAAVREETQVPQALRQSVLMALNAGLLDRRVKPELRRAVGAKDLRKFVTAGHVVVRFAAGTASGVLTVVARPSLPGVVEGMEPVWPMATYRVEYSGRMPARSEAEIAFDLHDFVYPTNTSALHLLRWDGRGYEDVTLGFDLRRRTVKGRATAKGEYVLMSSTVLPVGYK